MDRLLELVWNDGVALRLAEGARTFGNLGPLRGVVRVMDLQVLQVDWRLLLHDLPLIRCQLQHRALRIKSTHVLIRHLHIGGLPLVFERSALGLTLKILKEVIELIVVTLRRLLLLSLLDRCSWRQARRRLLVFSSHSRHLTRRNEDLVDLVRQVLAVDHLMMLLRKTHETLIRLQSVIVGRADFWRLWIAPRSQLLEALLV